MMIFIKSLFYIFFYICLINDLVYANEDDRSLCELPCHKGSCEDKIPMFFFNAKEGDCYKFNYKGCGGNDNQFLDERSCQDFCQYKNLSLAQIPEVGDKIHPLCFLPKERGNCSEETTRYFFNSKNNKCEKFTWEGCKSNPNNFAKRKSCKKFCETPANLILELDIKNWPKKPKKICRLPLRTKDSQSCEETEKDRYYYYNSKTDTCKEVYVSSSCLGNANAFPKKRDCENRCVGQGFDDNTLGVNIDITQDDYEDDEEDDTEDKEANDKILIKIIQEKDADADEDEDDEDDESPQKKPKRGKQKCNGFRCDDGQCIEQKLRCSGGSPDCNDGSDEKGCKLHRKCSLKKDWKNCGQKGKKKWYYFNDGNCHNTKSDCCNEYECFENRRQCVKSCHDLGLELSIDFDNNNKRKIRKKPKSDTNIYIEGEGNYIEEDETTKKPKDNGLDYEIEIDSNNKRKVRPKPKGNGNLNIEINAESNGKRKKIKRPTKLPGKTGIKINFETNQDEYVYDDNNNANGANIRIKGDQNEYYNSGKNKNGNIDINIKHKYENGDETEEYKSGKKRNGKIGVNIKHKYDQGEEYEYQDVNGKSSIRIRVKPGGHGGFEVSNLDSNDVCAQKEIIKSCPGQKTRRRFYFKQNLNNCLPFFTCGCQNQNCSETKSECYNVCRNDGSRTHKGSDSKSDSDSNSFNLGGPGGKKLINIKIDSNGMIGKINQNDKNKDDNYSYDDQDEREPRRRIIPKGANNGKSGKFTDGLLDVVDNTLGNILG